MKTTVYGCARCGQDHVDLEFKKFERPMGVWTHWAFCPVTNEPIVLKIVNNPLPYAQRDPRQVKPL